MVNKRKYTCNLRYLLGIICLLPVLSSTALNVESAMNYNFGCKAIKEPVHRKPAKISTGTVFKQDAIASVPVKRPTLNKVSIPKSKAPLPLKLVERKKGLPVKVVPQLSNMPAVNKITTDDIYNGILNSSVYLDYNSTIFNLSPNSVNVTYPLDKKHKEHQK
ncbi:MAG: hypothetical protein K0R14_1315 [Burkholderiales bacterium]|jgi:hypothetical protein|nr:hypothetical protein [Burkholderiales bacterium]